MTPAADAIQEALVRRLSVIGLWLLIINGMISAGIFGLPAEAARLAGAFSSWVFAICAVLILPIMLCFAQLGSYFAGVASRGVPSTNGYDLENARCFRSG